MVSSRKNVSSRLALFRTRFLTSPLCSQMPRLLLALPLVFLLTACSSSRPPTFAVAESTPPTVSDRTDQGIALLFTLSAQNDNDVALPLRDVEYTVELDGWKVFSGTRSAEATLRRLGTQQITLPAVIAGSVPSPATGRVPYRISGTVTYVTPGQIAEILFDTGVRVPTASFSGQGEVDLSQQPIP